MSIIVQQERAVGDTQGAGEDPGWYFSMVSSSPRIGILDPAAGGDPRRRGGGRGAVPADDEEEDGEARDAMS